MSFAVTKSPPVIVGPSEPITPAGNHLKLTSWDRSFLGFQITSFLVFDRPIQQPVEAIKKGLSKALAHYPPVAGRLAAGAGDGELYIECTGDGVPFVAASANCTLEDIKFLDTPSVANLLQELAVYYPDEGCPLTDPLLLMQVAEFACGGVVVGVTWHHVIADGQGMTMFLQAVGELTRGVAQPSVVPLRHGDSLPVLPPPIVAANQAAMTRGRDKFAFLGITIPSSVITRIKSECRDYFDGKPATVFEIVMAVLWRCRIRAIGADPDAPAPLAFYVNLRKLVGAEDNYYGNCTVAQLAVATCGEVADGDIRDVVKLVKSAKEKIPDMFKNGQCEIDVEELGVLSGYSALIVSSWRNIGFEAVDFGGGTPARVMSRWQQPAIPSCIVCLPCTLKDGADVLSICVKEEHADAFLKELAQFG